MRSRLIVNIFRMNYYHPYPCQSHSSIFSLVLIFPPRRPSAPGCKRSISHALIFRVRALPSPPSPSDVLSPHPDYTLRVLFLRITPYIRFCACSTPLQTHPLYCCKPRVHLLFGETQGDFLILPRRLVSEYFPEYRYQTGKLLFIVMCARVHLTSTPLLPR